jgi:hypothetical protein
MRESLVTFRGSDHVAVDNSPRERLGHCDRIPLRLENPRAHRLQQQRPDRFTRHARRIDRGMQ